MRAQNYRKALLPTTVVLGGSVLAVVAGWGLPSKEESFTGFNPASATLAVLGLAFLIIWGLRKLSPHLQSTLPVATSSIRLRATCPLGQGTSLVLVEVEGEKFLLSSSRDRLELVARLSVEEKKLLQPQKEPSEQ